MVFHARTALCVAIQSFVQLALRMHRKPPTLTLYMNCDCDVDTPAHNFSLEESKYSEGSEVEGSKPWLARPHHRLNTSLSKSNDANKNFGRSTSLNWPDEHQPSLFDNNSYIPTQYALPPLPQRSPSHDSEQSLVGQELGKTIRSLPLKAHDIGERHLDKIWLERIYNNIGLQDSPMSYPFENLWYTQKTIPELCLALPSNAHIQRYVSGVCEQIATRLQADAGSYNYTPLVIQ